MFNKCNSILKYAAIPAIHELNPLTRNEKTVCNK